MGDAIGRPCAFRYGALTLCGPVFNPVPLTHGFLQLPAGPSEPAHAIPQHPARNPRRVSHAQGLAIIRFRSPLLTEYPFLQVLRCFTSLRTPRPKPVPTHDGRWVPPFGNPRIKALLAAPRGISQPQTSFIGPVCQGIHHTPLHFRPLVPVGSTPRGASTSGLSTTCSAWGLQELEGSTECLSWSRLPA